MRRFALVASGLVFIVSALILTDRAPASAQDATPAAPALFQGRSA